MNLNNIRFRGYEIAVDNSRMEEILLPEGDSGDNLPSGNQPYFKQYGFRVPRKFAALYEKYNGINSDKYISTSLYYYYINPLLMNMNMVMAYIDKNNYERLFHDVNMPETIVHNIDGKYYKRLEDDPLLETAVINLLKDKEEFLIKPAIESGCGRSVSLIKGKRTENQLKELLTEYNSDFIIQDVVKQHQDLSRLNATSVNTCRVYTYLTVKSREYVVLGAAVRFGGNGAIKDNASAGGGFCKVHADGSIDDRIYQFRLLRARSLKVEKGIENLKFPSFDKVIDLCLSLHRRLPYMDLVGWDIAVDEHGSPLLIEINQYPDCEFIQICNGPMFGEYTDDLLEAISHHTISFPTVAKRHFENLSIHHDYRFELGRPNVL